MNFFKIILRFIFYLYKIYAFFHMKYRVGPYRVVPWRRHPGLARLGQGTGWPMAAYLSTAHPLVNVGPACPG